MLDTYLHYELADLAMYAILFQLITLKVITHPYISVELYEGEDGRTQPYTIQSPPI
jgi:hypothetical protein